MGKSGERAGKSGEEWERVGSSEEEWERVETVGKQWGKSGETVGKSGEEWRTSGDSEHVENKWRRGRNVEESAEEAARVRNLRVGTKWEHVGKEWGSKGKSGKEWRRVARKCGVEWNVNFGVEKSGKSRNEKEHAGKGGETMGISGQEREQGDLGTSGPGKMRKECEKSGKDLGSLG